MHHFVHSIGYVSSPYPQKFGIARQPHLVPAAQVCIHLNSEFDANSVRGLETFDYIWLHFVFHGAINEGWGQTVRPPRLGGKQKMGVFATRSPHRPNHLGLSLLKLERIETENGVRLYCSGGDILDKTPVLDIKPYLPFIESQPHARSGFATEHPKPLRVMWLPEANLSIPTEIRELAIQSIVQDPRPAHQHSREKTYTMRLRQWEFRFQINGEIATIESVFRLPEESHNGISEPIKAQS